MTNDTLADELQARRDRYMAIPYDTTDGDKVCRCACDIANLVVDNLPAILLALRTPPTSTDERKDVLEAQVERLTEALRRIRDHDGVSYRFGDEVRLIAEAALTTKGD